MSTLLAVIILLVSSLSSINILLGILEHVLIELHHLLYFTPIWYAGILGVSWDLLKLGSPMGTCISASSLVNCCMR